MKAYHFCNNCGKSGHLFHQCKQPIISLGIILFRYNEANNIEYLLIRRKDTLGYVDFVRGKYMLYNKTYLLNILSEMTLQEHNKLLQNDFNMLWSDLWGEHIGIQYRGEERVSKEKYENLINGINDVNGTYNLQSLIDEVKTKWTEPEWGFPKGRRNYQEKDLNCALREMEEETGYQKHQIKLVQNIIPFEEIFIGSNYKSYKHRYYLGQINKNIIPSNNFQETEVSKMIWATYESAIDHIRTYNYEKHQILKHANRLLTEYRLYS